MEMGKRQTSLKHNSPDLERRIPPEKKLKERRPGNETEDPEEDKDTWAFENPARERLRSTGIVQ
jgi:hypothetical protein